MQRTINPDAITTELIDAWKAGQEAQVINCLAADHPGLTAVMIVQGLHDRSLTGSDANSIANQLIDSRANELQEQTNAKN